MVREALPYYDDVTRSNAVASLGILPRGGARPGAVQGTGISAGIGPYVPDTRRPGHWVLGVLGDAGKFSANLLQSVWAYAHSRAITP
jgi:hypothetical protein